jgi:hypothetical protein
VWYVDEVVLCIAHYVVDFLYYSTVIKLQEFLRLRTTDSGLQAEADLSTRIRGFLGWVHFEIVSLTRQMTNLWRVIDIYLIVQAKQFEICFFAAGKFRGPVFSQIIKSLVLGERVRDDSGTSLRVTVNS